MNTHWLINAALLMWPLFGTLSVLIVLCAIMESRND